MHQFDQHNKHFTTYKRNQMSLSPPRTRRFTNTTYNLYWCYQCHRTIRISSQNPSDIHCSQCLGQFVCEMRVPRRRFVVDHTEYDTSPGARLLEALSLMLDPPVRIYSREGNDPWAIALGPSRRNIVGIPGFNYGRSRWVRLPNPSNTRDGWDNEPLRGRPRLVSLRPTGHPQSSAGPVARHPQGVGPRNYFTGPGLQELTENDRQDPPPAPDAAIEALPMVKLKEEHVAEGGLDSECPVCKEVMIIGSEVMILPCKHVYHSDCIVPWLRLHNSCPVCRTEITSPDDSGAVESVGSNTEPGGAHRCLNWDTLRSLWPFRERQSRINGQQEDCRSSAGGQT